MEQHGNIKLKWENDLLIVKVEGSFNEEGTDAAIKTYQKYIQASGISAWLQLELWEEHTLGGPDSMEKLPDIYFWSREQGCIATAIVVTDVVQKGTISTKLPDYIKVFYSQTKAIEWLEIQKKIG